MRAQRIPGATSMTLPGSGTSGNGKTRPSSFLFIISNYAVIEATREHARTIVSKVSVCRLLEAHVRGVPYHPMTQGKIDRWHQKLKNCILLGSIHSTPAHLCERAIRPHKGIRVNLCAGSPE